MPYTSQQCGQQLSPPFYQSTYLIYEMRFLCLQVQAYNHKASILEGLGQTHDALHQFHVSLEYLPGSASYKLHQMTQTSELFRMFQMWFTGFPFVHANLNIILL